MTKITKSTDLTKLEGDPQARAVAHPLLEQCDVEVRLPAWLGGSSLKIATRTRSGSAMVTSIATLLLVVSGCLVAGVAIAAGAPTWPAVAAGLIAPAAYFTLVHILCRRRSGRRG